MSIQIHTATSEEIPAILDMMKAFYHIDGYPFNKDESQINLEIFINDPGLGRIFLIRRENLTVGYLILTLGFSFEYHGKDAFIDEYFKVYL
jgi:hypothetical protein